MGDPILSQQALLDENFSLKNRLNKEKSRSKLLQKEVDVQYSVIGQLKKLHHAGHTKPFCTFGHSRCLIDYRKYNFSPQCQSNLTLSKVKFMKNKKKCS